MFSKKVTIKAESLPTLKPMLVMLDPEQHVSKTGMAIKLISQTLSAKYKDSTFVIFFEHRWGGLSLGANKVEVQSHTMMVKCEFRSKGDFNKFKLVENFTEE